VIFPLICKGVGSGFGKPTGEHVYFLTQYLIREGSHGCEVLEVTTDREGDGCMRRVASARVLAQDADVYCYPEKVQIHDRTRLVRLAIESGRRCTVFTGLDEHMTFVLDPDLSGFLRIHVYDIIPPRPSLSACIQDLEACGLFGELEIVFDHHVHDIRDAMADMYPCRAAGFSRTLDADVPSTGERVAGCTVGARISREYYQREVDLHDTCPLREVREEPFIARCCRKEIEGVGRFDGRIGAVVHWGSSPRTIASSIEELVAAWRDAS